MRFNQILIDGNYWARKYFSVHRDLYSNVNDVIVRTGMTHGFLLGLAALREANRRSKIVVCWDSGTSIRSRIMGDYKAARKSKVWDDAELYYDHLTVLRRFLKLTAVRQVMAPGEEGDDVMYTLASRSGGTTLIVSNDHDMHQLLSPRVSQLLAKKSGQVIYTDEHLKNDTGVTPEQYGHAMAIAGCPGDGVPGIKGIGMMTALKWVAAWPELVPSIINGNGDVSDWIPEVNSNNLVVSQTKYFKKGEKGPPNKMVLMLGAPWTVYETWQLTRLYDVWPLRYTRHKHDNDRLGRALEVTGLHECDSRMDMLGDLHK